MNWWEKHGKEVKDVGEGGRNHEGLIAGTKSHNSTRKDCHKKK